MKKISLYEKYFQEHLDKLGIKYTTQETFIYHQFKHTPSKRHKKYKRYTADFLISNYVVEIKGYSSHDTFRVLKPFIYDFLVENNYFFIVIPASYKAIDLWFLENYKIIDIWKRRNINT